MRLNPLLFTILVFLMTSLTILSCKKNNPASTNQNNNNDSPCYPDSQQVLTVMGNVINCGDSAVTNGTVVINISALYNETYYSNITNGHFSINIPYCNPISMLKVVAIDNNTLQRSDTNKIQVTGDTAYSGNLIACGTFLDTYIKYTVDDTSFTSYSESNDSIFIDSFITQYNVPLTGIGNVCYNNCPFFLQLTFPGNTIGTFIVNGNCGFKIKNAYSYNLPSTATVTYTHYGKEGDYVEGSFYIPFTNYFYVAAGAPNHLFKGIFKLKRKVF